MHLILGDLVDALYDHLQCEDVSQEFAILFRNLQSLAALLDLYRTVVKDDDDKKMFSRTVERFLDTLDLICSFPLHLLADGDGSQTKTSEPQAAEKGLAEKRASSSASSMSSFSSTNTQSADDDMLRRFCWPLGPKDQNELDKIRGPTCFAVITLSLFAVEYCELSSPALTKHANRLRKAVGYLRTMPKVSTIVRWAPGPRRDLIKGEKSALVALAFSSVLDVAKKARMDGKYQDPAVALHLCTVLSLLKEICVRHGELLAMLVQDDLIAQRFEALSSTYESAGAAKEPKSAQETAEWVLDSCLEQPAMSKDALVPHAFAGVPGALRALEEGENGCRTFMELQLKSSWERYSVQAMRDQATKVRTKREVTATDFHFGLARFEHARLASRLSSAKESDALARISWRQLTLESVLPLALKAAQQDGSQDASHWAVSGKEDHMRCRRLLVQNYSPRDYSNAMYNKQPAQMDLNGQESDREQQAQLLKLRDKIIEQSHAVADLRWFVWLGGKLASSEPLNEESKGLSSAASFASLASTGSFDQQDGSLAAFRWLGGKFADAQGLYDSQDPLAAFKWLGGKLHADERDAGSTRAVEQLASTTKEALHSSGKLALEVNPWITQHVRLQRSHFSLGKGEGLMHISSNAQLVTSLNVTRGRFEISNVYLYFYASQTEERAADNTPKLSSPTKTGNGGGGSSSSKESKARSKLGNENVVKRWRLVDLMEIFGRRYLLRSTALELFFKDRTNIFVCFSSAQSRSDFYNALLKQHTPFLKSTFKESLKPMDIFKRSDVMEKWRRREISNFDYLMHLNTMAGRTYNDLTQYPIFPWILRDYSSDSIDLSNPHIYRDLSKPIGALNPERFKEFMERYESFEEDESIDVPPFHYGSHYSMAGVVLHYLLRLEPFTSMAVELQSGRFDCPDRLFFSLQDSWRSSMESMSDVKELIPEFFYCPEMLTNAQRLPLGVRGDGGQVDDVILPPWAHGSVQEFIRIHREALESDYVSENLHHWIDLVFGYKQRGEEAKKAHNVFYYLTYEGAVDLDSIVDPMERHSIESQIAHFGQTPSQLLTKPHPNRSQNRRAQLIQRLVPSDSDDASQLVEISALRTDFFRLWSQPTNRFFNPAESVTVAAAAAGKILSFGSFLVGSKAKDSEPLSPRSPKLTDAAEGRAPPLVFIKCVADKVITVHEDLSVSAHRFTVEPLTLKSSSSVRTLSASHLSRSSFAQKVRRGAASVFMQHQIDMTVQSTCFACAKQGKLLLSANYYDGSLRAQNLDNYRLEEAVIAHRGRILCLALCEREEHVVTGGEDGLLTVWVLGGPNDLVGEVLSLFGGADGSNEVVGDSDNSKAMADDANRSKVLNVRNKIRGHLAPVTSVAISSGFSVIVSGSKIGQVLVHCLQQGALIRALNPLSVPQMLPVSALSIGPLTGDIVAVIGKTHLQAFTINGSHLSMAQSDYDVEGMVICNAGGSGREVLITNEQDGSLRARNVHALGKGQNVIPLEPDLPKPVCALEAWPEGDALVAGTQDGYLVVVQLSGITEMINV